MLAGSEVRFMLCSVVDRSFYAFTCPTCRETVRKPADSERIRLLTLGGVVPERWTIPAEALEDHLGPVLSWDDVLDFRSSLERTDLVAAVAAVR